MVSSLCYWHNESGRLKKRKEARASGEEENNHQKKENDGQERCCRAGYQKRAKNISQCQGCSDEIVLT